MSLCLLPPAGAPAATAPLGAAPAPGRHRTVRPSVALAPFVEHYWVTRWDRRGLPPRAAAMLLDPCVHLQLCDGRAELLGVMRGAYCREVGGAGCVVGVKFRPGGFSAFIGEPVVQWTDRTVPAAGSVTLPPPE